MSAPNPSTVPVNGDSLEDRLAVLENRIRELEANQPEDRVSIVVFSGELDRVLAAFIIATGAAAVGQSVSMFFTFWGYGAVRRKKVLQGKKFAERMMSVMSPGNSLELPVSKMNYFGMGAKMLRSMMKDKNVASLEDLTKLARELGVRMVACEMSRDLMGIQEDELMSGLETGGVATFMADAVRSRATLFI